MALRRPARAAAWLGALACLASCESAAPGQLLVRIDTDLRVRDEIDAVQVRVSSQGHPAVTRVFALGDAAGQRAIPGSFAAVAADVDVRRMHVEVDAMRGECRLFTWRTTVAVAPGGVTNVDAFLAGACAGHAACGRCSTRDACGSDALTCGRGGVCAPVDVAAARPDAGAPSPPMRPVGAPTQGAAVAITPDDRTAIVANRRSNSVTVLDLDLDVDRDHERDLTDPTGVTARATLTPPGGDEAHDPEAWAVVSANASDAAYLVLRRAQRVVRLDDLRGTPRFADAWAPTGSEPTALAITPSGRHLYVTNFAEGTVTVVATATMHVEMTIDLNATLVATGRLGDAQCRVGLAHPRAITITHDGDGDDADEVAYVTEFFSQARTPAELGALDPAADPGYWDVARVGLVYRIPLATNVPDAQPVALPPVTDTGFVDATGRATGCFANQLHAAAMAGRTLYVTGVCTSPAGPVGEATTDPRSIQTMSHATVFPIDTSTAAPTARAPVVMTAQFRRMYEGALPEGMAAFTPTAPVADDARRRMPLLPIGLAVVPGDYVTYVLGYGADAIFRMRFDERGGLAQVGSQGDLGFIDLAGDPAKLGRLPIGIAIGHQHTHTALVVNSDTESVSVLNLNQQLVARALPALPRVERTAAQRAAHEGRRLFVTGLGRWSWRGQAWTSCESCHPDGLTDGVTWFFPRGPRQTPSLDGSFVTDTDGHPHPRVFGWNATFDEVQDVENVVRTVMGGVGALVHRESAPPSPDDRIVFSGAAGDAATHTATSQSGLYGATSSISSPGAGGAPCSVIDDFDRVDAYVRSLRAPRRPVGVDPALVATGRSLFARSCLGCHGTPLWSTSERFYRPSEASNGASGSLRAARYTLPTGFARMYNPAVVDSGATFRTAAGITPELDAMQCALRAVGTLTRAGAAVAPAGVPLREVRADMTTAATGVDGYNVPSLLGLGLSAPYFHAGNARTLEEIFDPVFAQHHTAWSQNHYGSNQGGRDEVRAIVAFLLSIDDDEPAMGTRVPDYMADFNLCAQGAGMFP